MKKKAVAFALAGLLLLLVGFALIGVAAYGKLETLSDVETVLMVFLGVLLLALGALCLLVEPEPTSTPLPPPPTVATSLVLRKV